MQKKVAIVTGASSGFGLLSAVELAKNGFQVIAAMRNPGKSQKLQMLAEKEMVANSFRLLQLDVTSSESIEQFKINLSSLPSIDVLVNNAGFAIGGFSEEISLDEYRRQFETNLFGVIAITNAVLPFMRAQKSGRIINMSSISGRIGFPGLSPYVASKHALEGYSESLQLELRPMGIDVVLIEPGSYNTSIWESVDSMDPHQDSPYHEYMCALVKEIHIGKKAHGNPSDVAKLIATIAIQSNTPKLRYQIGKGVKRNIFLKNTLPWKLIEKVVIRRILGK